MVSSGPADHRLSLEKNKNKIKYNNIKKYIYIYLFYFFKGPSHQTVERHPVFGRLLLKHVTVLVMEKD